MHCTNHVCIVLDMHTHTHAHTCMHARTHTQLPLLMNSSRPLHSTYLLKIKIAKRQLSRTACLTRTHTYFTACTDPILDDPCVNTWVIFTDGLLGAFLGVLWFLCLASTIQGIVSALAASAPWGTVSPPWATGVAESSRS